MRGHRVWPVTQDPPEIFAAECHGTAADPVLVAATSSKVLSAMAAFVSAARQRPKGGSSPVIPFGESEICADIAFQDQSAKVGSSPDSKTLLSGMRARCGWTSNSLPSTSRTLHRQPNSMPIRQEASGPPPLRRCISAGGAGCGTSSSADGRTRSTDATASKGTAPSRTSDTGSASTCAAASSSSASLLDALQNVAEAASTTACALSSARQDHENALQKQREQFQLLMEGMRARSSAQRSSGPSSSIAALRAGLQSSTGGHLPTPTTSPPPHPHQPRQSEPQLLSIKQTYRGVHFSMPLGCRIESGERASNVTVLGPRVHVSLDFRDEGRNVVLVSSNCVCTVKRMDGRVLVNILPPLEGRSRSDS